VTDAGGGTTRRARITDSAVATGKGDDGTTGLLYGGRVAKDDARVEAYGTLDEAVAALGVARAEVGALAAAGPLPDGLAGIGELLLSLQRDAFVAAAELAANPDAADRLVDGTTRVDEPMVVAVEEALAATESRLTMPREFVVPGETRLSAAIEHARTVLRRAERRVVTLQRSGASTGPWLGPWLNRTADLLWVLARAAEHAEQRRATRARPDRPRTPGAHPG
jgi:cob(I)alamin adenosyltransferase